MARVEGFEPAHSGQQPVDVNGNPVAVGVWGDSTTGMGVFGTSGVLPPGVDNIPANIAGVEGHSIQNPGVFGRSIEDAGVSGESVQGLGMLGRSSTGTGVLGVTFAPSIPGEPPSAAGVFGSSVAGGNGVTGFVGSATGVVGSSVRGIGVRGTSGDDDGVSGLSLAGNGVRGVGGAGGRELGAGVFGSSNSGFGVRGVSTARDGTVGVTFGRGVGVSGLHFSLESGTGVSGVSVLKNGIEGFSFTGIGVRGEGRNGGVHGVSTSAAPNAGGVIGENPNGFAGVFLGKVRITGSLSKGGGGFEIDHPLDPENRCLSHSFVESPDMLNVYNGNVTTDAKGEAVVTLPDYFEALNQEFCYQLTVMGQFAQAIVADEIRDSRFMIKSDRPRVKVSWQVTGIRKDAWAVANRIPVEAEKTADEKGHYLHPDLWQRPAEAGRQPESQGPAPETDQLRRASELMPEELRPRLERLLQTLLRGDRLDREELRNAMVAAGEAALDARSTIDRSRLEDDWRTLEASMQRMRPMAPDDAGTRLRQLGQLLPEQLRPRLEQHLQALLRGDRLDRGELENLVTEAGELAGRYASEGRPMIDRARLEAEWRQVEQLMQRIRSAAPRNERESAN
jgi:hypothetical protein